MSETKDGNFFERHPFLTRSVVMLICTLVIGAARYLWTMYDKYDSRGIDRPGVYIEKDVEDTGEYVGRGESVSVTRDDKSYVGKHVRFVTTLSQSEEGRQKGKYICVAADLALKKTEYYALMSDESILKNGKKGFLEIDGLVSGRLITEQKIGSMKRRLNIPILAVVDVQRVADEDVLGKIAPANRTVEPSVSASEKGVTACLESVEYCDDMTRFYVRIDNESDYSISAEMTACYPDGEEIGKPTEVNSLVGSIANPIVFGDIQASGSTKTHFCSTKPIGADEEIEIHLKLSAFVGKVTDGAFGLVEDEWEMALSYAPQTDA